MLRQISTATQESTLVPHRTPQLAQLLKAADTCKLVPLKRFLAAGGLPDTLVEVVREGHSALVPLLFMAIMRVAVDREVKGSLEVLLDAGADIGGIYSDATGKPGYSTALMTACELNSNGPLITLLERGADPCQQTPAGGVTALHIAAMHGMLGKCKLLIEADERTLTLRDHSERLPLNFAVAGGHVSAVELLHKQYGADVHTADHTGNTLLHLSADRDQYNEAVLAYLLECGLNVNPLNSERESPVYLCALTGNRAAAEMLLEHGADPLLEDDTGDNALIVACRHGHTGVVRVLLRSGMSASAKSSATFNPTPLIAAAAHGQVAVAKLLLQRGADVNQRGYEGNTALHVAALKSSPAIVSLLLEHGAAINARSDNGFEPLVHAALSGDVPFVQLFLDAGANVGAVSTDSTTVLHAAADNDHPARPKMLKLLLEHGGATAHLNKLAFTCVCCGRCTPLMVCKQPAQGKLLLSAGADAHKIMRQATPVYM
jgi:ankyrin repeat protein